MIEISKKDTAKLRELLLGSASVTLTTHVRQDGDALGSVTALLSFLKEVYRKDDVTAVLPGTCPGSLSFIIPEEYCNDFIFSGLDMEGALSRIGTSDLVVCLDCSGFGRAEGLTEAFLGSKAVKVQVDHHLEPHTDQFDLAFSFPEQSSTCELLYHILMALPEVGGDASAIPIVTAEALYTGMTTDTNNFANSVQPSTLGMASSLQAAGVDRERILGDLYHSYSEGRIRLLGYLLDRKLTITPKGAAYMVCNRKEMEEFGVGHEETEGFVNIPLAIKDVRISLFAKEDDGFYRISIRSKPGISARNLADTRFDGGGHELAAGGKVRPEGGTDPEEYVRLDVERKLEEFLV